MKNIPDFSDAKIDDVVYYLEKRKDKFHKGKIIGIRFPLIRVHVPSVSSYDLIFTYEGKLRNARDWEVGRLFWKPFDIPEESLVRPKDEESFIEIMVEAIPGRYRVNKIIPGYCNDNRPEYYENYLKYDKGKEELSFFRAGKKFPEWSITKNIWVSEKDWEEICNDIQNIKDRCQKLIKKNIEKPEKYGEEISCKW